MSRIHLPRLDWNALAPAALRWSSARLLCVEWDARELRFVAGSSRHGQAVVEHAARVPLPADEAAKSPAALAELLRATLNVHRVGGARPLLLLPRSSVDLRPLTLPPASDDELAQLVRNQALRELSAMNDGAVLDFVPLGDQPHEPRVVMAAALGGEAHQAAQGLCQLLRWQPERLGLRPYAAASLWRRQGAPEAGVCLLVDASNDEADLTAVKEGKVIFSRTARLAAPTDEEETTAPLLAEIHRTLLAILNQPGGERVSRVCIFGGPDEQRALVETLAEDEELAVELRDPFEGLALSDEMARHLPTARGRFAGLLGMLADAAAGERPAIDFAHPRRPPEPPNRVRKLALPVGAAAAALLLILFATAWRQQSALDAEIKRLTKDSSKLEESLKKAKTQQEAVGAVEQWAEGEVIWLDELRDVSARFPKRRDAVLLKLTMSRGAQGGVMELQGLVRDPSIVGRMESRLRDDHHEVRSKRVQENIREKTFTWQFESSLSVQPRTQREYRDAAAVAAETASAASAERER